jgi:divinyl protochlorophyllide a 8-vinyl-reductase
MAPTTSGGPATEWQSQGCSPASPADGVLLHDAPHGRIGPNAIIRVAEALNDRIGAPGTQALFESAGLAAYLARTPEAMVDEEHVARLQRQLRAVLGPEMAREISCDAGARTGDYLLAHRIPAPAQFVLRLLPAGVAARVLAKAISRHAWTFAGTGAFSYRPGRPFLLSITGCPLCRRISAHEPACDYYGAIFERIFRSLVSGRVRVTETDCQARGAPACTFEVFW